MVGLGIDGRTILEWILINTRNWVDSAQNRDYWRAFVNAALNLRVPQVMELVSLSLMSEAVKGLIRILEWEWNPRVYFVIFVREEEQQTRRIVFA